MRVRAIKLTKKHFELSKLTDTHTGTHFHTHKRVATVLHIHYARNRNRHFLLPPGFDNLWAALRICHATPPFGKFNLN